MEGNNGVTRWLAGLADITSFVRPRCYRHRDDLLQAVAARMSRLKRRKMHE